MGQCQRPAEATVERQVYLADFAHRGQLDLQPLRHGLLQVRSPLMGVAMAHTGHTVKQLVAFTADAFRRSSHTCSTCEIIGIFSRQVYDVLVIT